MYYMLGSENRTTNVEYTKLVQDKTERTELRNRMTWQTLRVACLPLKAKGICNECGMEKVTPDHIKIHMTMERSEFWEEILNAIKYDNSLNRLADLYQEKLGNEWIFYKKAFKFFKLKRRQTLDAYP